MELCRLDGDAPEWALTIALFEHRPPLTGPQASGEAMMKRGHHVVLEIGDAPARLPVLDRYSGEYLPEGNDHPDTSPIPPSIYRIDGV